MNPESLLWRRLFPLACGVCAIVITPAYGDVLYSIPTFATGPGAVGKSYDPSIVSVVDHAGLTGTTAAQLLALQNLNPAAGTSAGSPHFQNNVAVDATQTPGTLLTDVGTQNVSYFQFGTTAAPGADILPTSLTFDTRRATTVPGLDRKYTVQVSLNGGSYTTIASEVPVQAVRGGTATHVTVPLTNDLFQFGVILDFRVFTIGGGPLEYTNIALNGTVELPGPFVETTSAALTYTGGTFVLTEQGGAVVNPAGITISLSKGGTSVPATVVATKTGAVTTATVTAAIDPNTDYDYILTVPQTGGGDPAIQGTLTSYKLPGNLAGLAGTVGTWGIREYNTAAANNILTAVTVATSSTPPPLVEASYPVFNHSDPDTNDLTACGQFNNDFPILTNGPGDQAFVVVGKTKVTVPAAGDYTFAVHSDDGFAMRVMGPSGGRFTSNNGGGIDGGDNQTLFFDGGTGDSNTHGVYHFDAAGTYDITYLGYDGGGGAFYEVAWSPGVFTEDRQTNTWKLVGTPGDPSVPPFRPRFAQTLPGVAGTAGNWGIRTYLNAQGVGNTRQAADFAAATTRLPSDPDGKTVDVQRTVLNAIDPENPGNPGVASGDQPFPGNTSADDNNVVTVAKSRINIATAGTYTFLNNGDDGFLLRIRGVNGAPNPSFRRVTDNGNFNMSFPNEWYTDTNGYTRAIIDLPAGQYDLEYLQYENTGGFYYELTAAPGEWPSGTTPTNGWQLVGDTTAYGAVNVPKMAPPGWTVETSLPGLVTINNTIADAQASIDATVALDPQPSGLLTTWNSINFTDPEAGAEGAFSPSNTFPLNTSSPDTNYAMLATGSMVVTVAGEYRLGYQGDDGGYMIIDGPGDPFFKSIVFSNHPTIAKLQEEEVGVTGRNNMMVTETASPNSLTIGAVDLQVGTYTIKTLMFQGTGNSFWEVIGAQTSTAPVFNYPLLATDGPATVTAPSGLALVEQVVAPVTTPFNITGFTTTGSPATSASFTFASANAGTYAVQVSTDLVNWSTLTATITGNGDGTSAVTANFTGQTVNGQAIIGQSKLFVRVVRTF